MAPTVGPKQKGEKKKKEEEVKKRMNEMKVVEGRNYSEKRENGPTGCWENERMRVYFALFL